MSQLSSYLHQANIHGLTQNQIVREAAAAGIQISQTTVSRYMGGLHPTPPSRQVLAAFAHVFNIPLKHLLALGGLPEELGEFELPTKAQVLDREERELVLGLVNFLADRKLASPAPASVQELTPDGEVFDPAGNETHRVLVERYGANWRRHYYDLAAHRGTTTRQPQNNPYPTYLGAETKEGGPDV